MHPIPLRTRRLTTRAAFFIPGFVISAWGPLVPFAKARAGLNDAELGLALLFLGVGSIGAMPLSGLLAARYGCRAVLLCAALTMAAVLPALGAVASLWLLGLSLLLFGAAIGAMDCTVNMQAVQVERDAAQPLMSGFHAWYSIGCLAGASAMTLLLSAGAGTLLATTLLCVASLAVVAGSAHGWLSARTSATAQQLVRPSGLLLLIGTICFVMFLVEGSMLDWSAIFLAETKAVPVEQAGWGFVAFSVAMTLMRLQGDRVVARFGRQRVILIGGLVAVAGMMLATLMPGLGAALLGYALLGLGCANIVPIMFSWAGQQNAVPESLAIPIVTTLGYAGILLGPALIGFIAQAASLSVAILAVTAGLAATVVVAAYKTPKRPPAP